MKNGWVYILECSDGCYYTGSTSHLETRIAQHQSGTYDGFTAKRRPIKLRGSDKFSDMYQAVLVERQIKGWSRKKKEALINGNFEVLHKLAECKNGTHHNNRHKTK